MSEGQTRLDRLSVQMRGPANDYAAFLRTSAGVEAAALVFYGSVLSPEFKPVVMPARNVLVLNSIDLNLLRRVADQGARFGKRGIAAPVIMTPDYIQASRDTFALELIEIQQQHLLVFGIDYFTSLVFEPAHVRLQCERELKTAVVGMHHALLTAAGQDKLLNHPLLHAAEGLVRTMRGMLWLKDIRRPMSALQTLEELQRVVDRRLPGLNAALDASTRHGWEDFQAVYDDVTALGKLIDGW